MCSYSFETTMRSLSVERLALYSNHIQSDSNSTLFDATFFTQEFAGLIEKQLLKLSDCFQHELIGYDDKSLLGTMDISIEVDWEEEFTFEIVPDENHNRAIIFVSPKIIFLSDLLTARFAIGEYAPDKNIESFPVNNLENELSLTPRVANVLLSDLSTIVIQNISATKKIDSELDFWLTNSTMSIFFLLSHEYAHYVCGHTEFYKDFEQNSENYDENEINNIKLNLLWPAEFIADMYATMRLMYSLCKSSIKLNKCPSKRYNLPHEALSAILVPATILEVINSNNQSSFESLSHPPPFSRFFGCFVAVDVFIRRKRYNFGKKSADGVDEFLEKLEFERIPIQAKSILICYTGILNRYQKALSLLQINPENSPVKNWSPKRDIKYFLEQFNYARMGFVDPKLTLERNISIGDYNVCLLSSINLWLGLIKNTCYLNVGYFSIRLKREFFERLDKTKQITNIIDPIYENLDEWMSKVQRKQSEFNGDSFIFSNRQPSQNELELQRIEQFNAIIKATSEMKFIDHIILNLVNDEDLSCYFKT